MSDEESLKAALCLKAASILLNVGFELDLVSVFYVGDGDGPVFVCRRL